MFNGLLVIICLLLFFLTGGFIWLCFAYQKLTRNHNKLNNEIDRMNRDLVGISSAAVEVDKQLSYNGDVLQGILKELAESQEIAAPKENASEASVNPYQEIINMVQKGTEPSELVRHFGVSYDEADLLIRLHGVEKIK
jgi:hypothetical protein